MSTKTEDRLRRALASRAEQVTPESLRPADLSIFARSGRARVARRRGWIMWGVPVMAAAAAVIAVGVVAFNDVRGGRPVQPTTTFVTGSECPNEQSLIEAALAEGGVSADVDGDGRADTVVTAVAGSQPPTCRAFVGVRTAGGDTYSTAFDPSAVPAPDMSAEVVGVPDLGGDGRADLVVDTHALADGALAQLFTLTDTGLLRVPAPAFEDGNFIVEGGGVITPQGTGCTADGSLVISMATAANGGRDYQVTRQVYAVSGSPIRFGDPSVTSTDVPADRLATRFPEFAGHGFDACGGALRADP